VEHKLRKKESQEKNKLRKKAREEIDKLRKKARQEKNKLIKKAREKIVKERKQGGRKTKDPNLYSIARQCNLWPITDPQANKAQRCDALLACRSLLVSKRHHPAMEYTFIKIERQAGAMPEDQSHQSLLDHLF
jgi:hypothetical protein